MNFEAYQTSDISVECFIQDDNCKANFTAKVDINAQIKNIRDEILKHGNAPAEVRNVDSNNWRVYLVCPGNSNKLLENNRKLCSYDTWQNLTSNGHLLVVNEGPPDGEITGGGVVKETENIWPIPAKVIHRDGTIVSEFTMDFNVTLPAQSIVDSILQHPTIPEDVKTEVEPWRLFLVHEAHRVEEALPEEVPLDAIAGKDILTGQIHLKVAIVE